MAEEIYRVQDGEGRGPWRPGFSWIWVEDRPQEETDYLIPWAEEWPDLLPSLLFGGPRYGAGCRTPEQLRRWFTPGEYECLKEYGYNAVRMGVDRVLRESERQLFFARYSEPLHHSVTVVDLYEREFANG